MVDSEMSDEQEEQLLVQAAQADPSQFASLYDRYLGRIYRYIAARVTDKATVEDLTSQVFLKALENLPRYRPNAPFAAWLFTIARNTVISHFRQKRPALHYDDSLDSLASEHEGSPGQTGGSDDLAQLSQLLAQLDKDERELLHLRFAAGLSSREVARVLGRSRGAVKMATYRLLQRLQRDMVGKQ